MTTQPITDRIATLEAELAAAQARLNSIAANVRPGRGKQGKRRVDSAFQRGGEQAQRIVQLEREIANLRAQATRPVRSAAPVDFTRLVPGCAVRTDDGWFRVLKVNRITVKLEVPPGPGWLDTVKRTAILEIRSIAAPAEIADHAEAPSGGGR